MTTLFGFFSLLSLLGLVYWAIVRPVFIKQFISQHRLLLGKLEWAMIDGAAGSTSEAAHKLLYLLRNPDVLEMISFSSLIVFSKESHARTKAQIEKDRMIQEGSPEWLADLYEKRLDLVVAAVLANSPVWWPVFGGILIACYLSEKVQLRWQETQNLAALWSPGGFQAA